MNKGSNTIAQNPSNNSHGLGGALLPSVSIEYMYRDASNYKRYEVVNISNPEKISVFSIRKQFDQAISHLMPFPDRPIFRPELVGFPTVFLCDLPGCRRNEDDHDWHELISIEETAEAPTVDASFSVGDFIELLRTTHSGLFRA
jgi:hypothetical protein